MSTYLLRTKPQGEAKAVAGLIRYGHAAWSPTEERVIRASGRCKRKRVVARPLAPRYVVAEIADPYSAVHAVDEITGVVSTAGQTSLRQRDVDALRRMTGSTAQTTVNKTLTVGQQITVRDGPFRDRQSTIAAIDGHDATLMLDMLGRPTPVTMPLAYLDPV